MEKKGFDILLKACRLLVEKEVEFKCFLVGSGECELQLRSLVDQLALHEHVTIAGPQPQAMVKQMMQSAAVLAAPCVDGRDGNRDGLPTVLLEAMALGTPCVSTNVTGIPELVRNDDTGLLVQQGDAAALAAGLARCLNDAELRVRLAVNAYELIQEKFDAAVNAKIQRQLFRAFDVAGSQLSSPCNSLSTSQSLSTESRIAQSTS